MPNTIEPSSSINCIPSALAVNHNTDKRTLVSDCISRLYSASDTLADYIADWAESGKDEDSRIDIIVRNSDSLELVKGISKKEAA